MRDQVDFLHVDEHQCFLQADTNLCGGHGQACLKYPKQQVWNMLVVFQERRKIEFFCGHGQQGWK